jgi:NAD(P)-dependent dehydrogenase (short-subunit alcohol dehydrogenase family)
MPRCDNERLQGEGRYRHWRGSGLGEAIAKSLAAKRVMVVVSAINLTGAERVAPEIADSGGTGCAGEHDIAKPEDWERVVAINLNGVLFGMCFRHVLSACAFGMCYQIPAMLRAGARNSAIVNVPLFGRLVDSRRKSRLPCVSSCRWRHRL